MTLKAAFIAAFFALFFIVKPVYSQQIPDDIDLSQLESKEPESIPTDIVSADSYGGSFVGEPLNSANYYCEQAISRGLTNYYSVASATVTSQSSGGMAFQCAYWPNAQQNDGPYTQSGSVSLQLAPVRSCPPVAFPAFDFGYDENSDGEPDSCYRTSDIYGQEYDGEDPNTLDNQCKNLLMDSGNNLAQNTCYTTPSGMACEMKRNSGSDAGSHYDYYSGVGHNIFGCEESEYEPHDTSGMGSPNDGCVTMSGGIFCEANNSNHCNTELGGAVSCDEGCFYTEGGGIMCDASKFPDIGEGNSAFFDDYGKCSVVAGSSYKGACEELGGDWTDYEDFEETTCPPLSIAGSCSFGGVANPDVAGGCANCLDMGGVWSPSINQSNLLSDEAIGLDNVNATSTKTNEKIDTLELTTRKGNEALIATIKSGNERSEGQITDLTNIMRDSLKQLQDIKEEQEDNFTTNSYDSDKSLLNSLFDANAIAELQLKQTELKTEITNLITSINTEARALISISASGAGYQTRNVNFTYSSVDLSLSRLQQFFILLGGAVMFAALVYSFVIIMGPRK